MSKKSAIHAELNKIEWTYKGDHAVTGGILLNIVDGWHLMADLSEVKPEALGIKISGPSNNYDDTKEIIADGFTQQKAELGHYRNVGAEGGAQYIAQTGRISFGFNSQKHSTGSFLVKLDNGEELFGSFNLPTTASSHYTAAQNIYKKTKNKNAGMPAFQSSQ